MAIVEADVQDLRNYSATVKEAGFNIDEEMGESEGVYYFNAKNEDGMHCCVASAEGQAFVAIGKDLSSILGE